MSSSRPYFQILLCDGPSCGLCHDSASLKDQLEEVVASNDALTGRVAVRDYTCFGRCGEGPNMLVREVVDAKQLHVEPSVRELDGVEGFYTDLDEARCKKIMEEHCAAGKPVGDWVEVY